MAEAPARHGPKAADGPVPAEEISELLEVVSREPACAEAPPSTLDAALTPNDRFFVRNHFPVPHLDRSTWRLEIGGKVSRPLSLSYEELTGRESRTLRALLECAGNSRRAMYPPAEGVPWNHGALGAAEWHGVPLAELLAEAGAFDTASEVILTGADRGTEPGVRGTIAYEMSLPLEKARDPDTLVALRMNGEPLSAMHGAPARVVVPGWYGMASVKWLTRITVSAEPFRGFFRTESYVMIPEGPERGSPPPPVTTLRVKSLITWPAEGATLPPGLYSVRGAAWSGESPVAGVELTSSSGRDGSAGPWLAAKLLDEPSTLTWCRWECPIDFRVEGHFVLRARASDRSGNSQPLHARWNFRGMSTNSIHAVRVTVRGPR
ncbi:MAG: sulfite oxidase [Thermoplasmata archaeon]|nr:sulfite oxidase [Thermoplasmata archaeon]